MGDPARVRIALLQLDADAARLSAFIRTHIGIDGHYAFHLPDLGGDHRQLRDPDAPDDGD